jgi:acyl-CoA thioesterase-1
MGVEKKTTIKRLLVILFVVLTASLVLIALHSIIHGNNPNVHRITRIACVGDSITEESGYPRDLWMMLGANYRIGNYGVGGSTILLNSNKPYMNQTAFQNAKHFLPDIVVVMLGTNDAIPNNYIHIDNFVDDYVNLVEAFQALESNPKIWLVLPPPIYDNILGPNSANLVDGVLPRIEQVANEMNLPVINVFEALSGHPEYSKDGVHLSGQGVELLVNEIYMAINGKATNMEIHNPH